MRNFALRMAYRWWLGMCALLGIAIGLQLREWIIALQHYGAL